MLKDVRGRFVTSELASVHQDTVRMSETPQIKQRYSQLDRPSGYYLQAPPTKFDSLGSGGTDNLTEDRQAPSNQDLHQQESEMDLNMLQMYLLPSGVSQGVFGSRRQGSDVSTITKEVSNWGYHQENQMHPRIGTFTLNSSNAYPPQLELPPGYADYYSVWRQTGAIRSENIQDVSQTDATSMDNHSLTNLDVHNELYDELNSSSMKNLLPGAFRNSTQQWKVKQARGQLHTDPQPQAVQEPSEATTPRDIELGQSESSHLGQPGRRASRVSSNQPGHLNPSPQVLREVSNVHTDRETLPLNRHSSREPRKQIEPFRYNSLLDMTDDLRDQNVSTDDLTAVGLRRLDFDDPSVSSRDEIDKPLASFRARYLVKDVSLPQTTQEGTLPGTYTLAVPDVRLQKKSLHDPISVSLSRSQAPEQINTKTQTVAPNAPVNRREGTFPIDTETDAVKSSASRPLSKSQLRVKGYGQEDRISLSGIPETQEEELEAKSLMISHQMRFDEENKARAENEVQTRNWLETSELALLEAQRISLTLQDLLQSGSKHKDTLSEM